MIAFRDTVNNVVKADGVNGVTRKAIFRELNNIHEFNAEGMFGTIDLAGRKTSPCHVLMQVTNGDFKRHLPDRRTDLLASRGRRPRELRELGVVVAEHATAAPARCARPPSGALVGTGSSSPSTCSGNSSMSAPASS